jgi:hypothetical protein
MPMMSSRLSPMTGKTRMRGAQRSLDDLVERVLYVDTIHLGTRNHHVAHRHVGHLKRAFDDRKGIRIEQIAFESGVQQHQQLFPIFRLAHQKVGQSVRGIRGVAGQRNYCPCEVQETNKPEV